MIPSRPLALAFAVAAVAACEPAPPLVITAPVAVAEAPPTPEPVAAPVDVVPVPAVESPPAIEDPAPRPKGGDVKRADAREVKAWANRKKN
jgi:hypothetical protein